MNHGLSSKTVEKIHSVLKKHIQIESATLYGSRAKGTHRPGSDIDLTLNGNTISTDIFSKVLNDLDELMLPYEIDLSIFHELEHTELKNHIRRVGKVFYENRPLNPLTKL